MIKSFNLLFALLIFGGYSLIGQNDLRFGLFVQPGMSWIKSDANNVDAKGGFSFGWGLAVDKIFQERYAFSTGFTHRFYKMNTDYNLSFTDTAGVAHPYIDAIDYKMQYIEIPLTLKLRTNEQGHMTYFGQIGGILGFPIKTRYDRMNGYDSSLNRDNEKAREFSKVLNVGLNIGAGVEFSLDDRTRLFGGLDFNQGFLNIIDDKKILGDNDERKITLGTISVKAGVFF